MKEIDGTIEHQTFNETTEELFAKIIEVSKKNENAEGWLQILLYYIDVYTTQPTTTSLTHIHSLMELYRTYIQKCKGDCSFGKGKAGFLYVAIRLSEIDTSKTFTEDAFALLEEDLHNFIISPYTNNSLFTGRAGCLLVLDYYHAVINNLNVKKWIDALAEKLISQVQATDKGLYWNDRIEKLNGLLNFEYGNAGIGYTLLKLSETYTNDELIAIAKQVYTYQRQFWDAHLGWKATKKGIENTKTYAAALEAVQKDDHEYFGPLLDNLFIHVGVARFTLHVWQKTNDDTIQTDFINYLDRCKQLFEHSKTQLSVQKAVLLGTLFIEAAQIVKDEKYLEEAKTIANFIKEQYPKQIVQHFSDAVVIAQRKHFELALKNETICNALVPTQTIVNEANQQRQTLSINAKERIIQNTFPRTFSYLKTHHKNLIAAYVTQLLQEKAVFNFMVFIKKNLNQFSLTHKKQVSEILKLEISVQNLKKSIQNYAHLEAKNIHTYQTIQTLFTKSDQELIAHTLQLNPHAKKLTTAWNWELKQGKISEEKLQLPASKMNVYILPYYTNLIKEYWQNPYNVVLEHFKSQTQIATVITQLKQFYHSQDAIFIDNFSQFIMAETSYVLENLDMILLKIIKEYMTIGLLEIVQHTTKSN